jgi:hypothetical protein
MMGRFTPVLPNKKGTKVFLRWVLPEMVLHISTPPVPFSFY